MPSTVNKSFNVTVFTALFFSMSLRSILWQKRLRKNCTLTQRYTPRRIGMNTKIVGAILFLLSGASWASFIGPEQKELPETSYRKCSSGFCAELVLSSNSEVALRNWNTPSEGVYFPTSEEMKKGEVISAFIVFKLCGKTEQGNCRLTQKITIYQPDGKVYSRIPESEVWYDKQSPEGQSIGLSADLIKLIVEPHELVGTYKFEVLVKDYVSGKTVNLVKSINVSE